ncbi:pyrroloquinoline quinone biosynthesis protein PqqE [Sorangium sp. So ce1097]|uniref:pyrroloquinoline quinone biosynthesis protein PqqE n=1 Tax=Sorangium sp. So ce1097 TaxID=3133330 RepID=UPI003F6013BE
MTLAPGDRLALASKARLVRDRASGREVLLYPERGLALNPVAAAVAARLDGARTVAEIAAEIAAAFAAAPPGEVERDVIAFLEQLAARGLLERRDEREAGEGAREAGEGAREAGDGAREAGDGAQAAGDAVPVAGDKAERRAPPRVEPVAASSAPPGEAAADAAEHRPYTLIAELTYRCPLRCPYCSNPVELARAAGELSTEDWCRVFAEAVELGVMQVHLTGGEPLARRDLEALVRRARELGLYTNLITSGVPLARERLAALRAAGVDNVQLSVQDADAARADRIAGFASFDHKLAVAGWVKAEGLPLTVNVVLHRANIENVPAIIALAERLGADRLELANTQYLGWALANREALLPAREQLERAFAVASAARERLLGRMEMVFVTPDYHAAWPRACMDGWARRYLHVAPDGLVLPCHAAHTIPGLRFESVRERPLASIWRDSPGMSRFRGDAWMPPPCQGCDRRGVDFGGCRCQAYHLTGDAAATDPACALAPAHGIVEEARLRAASARAEPRYLYRSVPR